MDVMRVPRLDSLQFCVYYCAALPAGVVRV